MFARPKGGPAVIIPSMQLALRTLLDGVIDYAGLFPPAKLDMPAAVANYIRYRSGEQEWIVSRFVCSASRLQELRTELERQGARDLPLTVVGTPASDLEGWQSSLEADAQALNAFLDGTDELVSLEAFEVRLPSNELASRAPKDLAGFRGPDLYVELPWGDGMQESLHLLAETEWLRAKARTGGLTADAFPSPEELSGYMHLALSLDLPFKLTAGLHHPFPRQDAQSGGAMHGFLNVLVAGALAYSEDLPAKALPEILRSGSDEFAFSDGAVGWREHRASLNDIEGFRELFVGIGSCSVEEPLEDLASEGLCR
jgi:hypothetical protein